MSDCLRHRGMQHARLPCPSLSPRACSNSCPLSRWCHPTISSSLALFFCLQFFPASVSFPRSQLFTVCGQSIGASASASVLPKNIQDWFPLGLTGLISLQFGRLSRVFSNTTVQKHQFFGWHSSLFMVQLSHSYMTTGKTIIKLKISFHRRRSSIQIKAYLLYFISEDMRFFSETLLVCLLPQKTWTSQSSS